MADLTTKRQRRWLPTHRYRWRVVENHQARAWAAGKRWKCACEECEKYRRIIKEQDKQMN